MRVRCPRSDRPRAPGLALACIAASAILAKPSVQTSPAIDRVAAEALPSLAGAEGKRYARRTVRRRFEFFRYASEKGIDCGSRLLRTRRRCELRWYFGDIGYPARVTVRYVPCRGAICWVGRYGVAALNEYCRYVMRLPRSDCTPSSAAGRGGACGLR